MNTVPDGFSVVAEDNVIVIKRVLDAPRELVFKIWTDPEHVARWWGPQGFTCGDCFIDLRAGGQFSLQMRAPDGMTYPCHGTVREVAAPERIVYTGEAQDGHPCGGGLPPRSTVTITFDEQDGRTTITIDTRMALPADRDAAEGAGFVPGWTTCLDRFAEVLAGHNQGAGL
jgi:uncharacterized protein YndB with AHSA1/START domain